MRGLLVAAATIALLVGGCAADTQTGAPPTGGTAATTAEPAGDVEEVLARHGLDAASTVEIIDTLDRTPLAERDRDLMASVGVGELVVSVGTDERRLAIPDGQFYLSVAPYVRDTHECFNHSLTTCTGELRGEEVDVRIVDATGTVLVDGTRTTFDNGFVGFWLPRGIEGTLSVGYDGREGTTAISTGDDAPTCLTTLQLA